MLLNDRVFHRTEGTHVQISPGATDRCGIRCSWPMDPLQCSLPFSWQNHCTLAQCPERFGWKCWTSWAEPRPDSRYSLWPTTSFSCRGAEGAAGSPLCCVGFAQPAPAPGLQCTRAGSGCSSAPVCRERGRAFHNCSSLFAPEAKVAGSLGRALWWTVDTGSYLWEAEIAAIFSSVLGPCTVVFVISPQLSAPPALLRGEKGLLPGMRKRLHVASLWGSVVKLVPSTTDSSGRRVPLSRHVSPGLSSSFNEYLPQHILVQDMVAPAPLGCSPTGLLREGTLSFSPPEGPSFPCHAPSRVTSTSRLE